MAVWTPEEDLIVTENRNILSASQIADLIPGKTRNAVLGRVSRLGLPRLNAPKKPRPKRSRAQRIIQPKKMAPLPPEKPSEQPSLNIPFMDLNEKHCREITGRGNDGLLLSCGHPTVHRWPYCAWHGSINYTPEGQRQL